MMLLCRTLNNFDARASCSSMTWISINNFSWYFIIWCMYFSILTQFQINSWSDLINFRLTFSFWSIQSNNQLCASINWLHTFWMKFQSQVFSIELSLNDHHAIQNEFNSTSLNIKSFINMQWLFFINSWIMFRKSLMLNWILLYKIWSFIQSMWSSLMILKWIFNSYILKFIIHCMKLWLSCIMNRFIILTTDFKHSFSMNSSTSKLETLLWLSRLSSLLSSTLHQLIFNFCWIIMNRLILIMMNNMKK